MKKRAPSPAFLNLQRLQIDKLLLDNQLHSIAAPKGGWVRAIRTALGMSAAQLGRRLKMTAQGVQDIERRERDKTITIAKLTEVGDALDCDVVVGLVPRRPLTEIILEQAQRKAKEERNRVVHTMRLEAQQSGVADALDLNQSVDAWLTTKLRKLWE